MKFTIFETDSNGSEKCSLAETIEAVSGQKATERYQEEFRLAAPKGHLKVTTEGGAHELIALRGGSLQSFARLRYALTDVTRGTASPISKETCGW